MNRPSGDHAGRVSGWSLELTRTPDSARWSLRIRMRCPLAASTRKQYAGRRAKKDGWYSQPCSVVTGTGDKRLVHWAKPSTGLQRPQTHRQQDHR